MRVYYYVRFVRARGHVWSNRRPATARAVRVQAASLHARTRSLLRFIHTQIVNKSMHIVLYLYHVRACARVCMMCIRGHDLLEMLDGSRRQLMDSTPSVPPFPAGPSEKLDRQDFFTRVRSQRIRTEIDQ